jgi:hypothetical protein
MLGFSWMVAVVTALYLGPLRTLEFGFLKAIPNPAFMVALSLVTRCLLQLTRLFARFHHTGTGNSEREFYVAVCR